jgi:hypothetical protein
VKPSRGIFWRDAYRWKEKEINLNFFKRNLISIGYPLLIRGGFA